MNGILGKISEVKKTKSRSGTSRLHISFRPVCRLPNRTKVPAWLEDQTLKVLRDVADVREAGEAGDGVVLTAKESAPWLHPLVVEPQVAYGKLPSHINLRFSSHLNSPLH